MRSHGVKYTGREIEQAAKKTLVYMEISGATHETGGTDPIRRSKLGVRSSENLECGPRTLARPAPLARTACRACPASLALQTQLTLEFSHCYGEHMALPNWRIGRVLGIPIHLHASWFVVFFFVSWSLATGYLPETLPGLSTLRYWGMGGIAALLLFLSVLLHELGHSYVALRYQIPIRQITLFIFGGDSAHGKGTAQSAGRVFDRDGRTAREFDPGGWLSRRSHGGGFIVRAIRVSRTRRPRELARHGECAARTV